MLVNDAVEAIIKIAQESKTIGQVYNIGGQGEITIKDLANKIIKRTKSSQTVGYKQSNRRKFNRLH